MDASYPYQHRLGNPALLASSANCPLESHPLGAGVLPHTPSLVIAPSLTSFLQPNTAAGRNPNVNVEDSAQSGHIGRNFPETFQPAHLGSNIQQGSFFVGEQQPTPVFLGTQQTQQPQHHALQQLCLQMQQNQQNYEQTILLYSKPETIFTRTPQLQTFCTREQAMTNSVPNNSQIALQDRMNRPPVYTIDANFSHLSCPAVPLATLSPAGIQPIALSRSAKSIQAPVTDSYIPPLIPHGGVSWTRRDSRPFGSLPPLQPFLASPTSEPSFLPTGTEFISSGSADIIAYQESSHNAYTSQIPHSQLLLAIPKYSQETLTTNQRAPITAHDSESQNQTSIWAPHEKFFSSHMPNLDSVSTAGSVKQKPQKICDFSQSKLIHRVLHQNGNLPHVGSNLDRNVPIPCYDQPQAYQKSPNGTRSNASWAGVQPGAPMKYIQAAHDRLVVGSPSLETFKPPPFLHEFVPSSDSISTVPTVHGYQSNAGHIAQNHVLGSSFATKSMLNKQKNQYPIICSPKNDVMLHNLRFPMEACELNQKNLTATRIVSHGFANPKSPIMAMATKGKIKISRNLPTIDLTKNLPPPASPMKRAKTIPGSLYSENLQYPSTTNGGHCGPENNSNVGSGNKNKNCTSPKQRTCNGNYVYSASGPFDSSANLFDRLHTTHGSPRSIASFTHQMLATPPSCPTIGTSSALDSSMPIGIYQQQASFPSAAQAHQHLNGNGTVLREENAAQAGTSYSYRNQANDTAAISSQLNSSILSQNLMGENDAHNSKSGLGPKVLASIEEHVGIIFGTELVNDKFYLGLLHTWFENNYTCRAPYLSGRLIPLKKLFYAVMGQGGFVEMRSPKQWREIGSMLGFAPTNTNVPSILRRAYMSSLAPFEKTLLSIMRRDCNQTQRWQLKEPHQPMFIPQHQYQQQQQHYHQQQQHYHQQQQHPLLQNQQHQQQQSHQPQLASQISLFNSTEPINSSHHWHSMLNLSVQTNNPNYSRQAVQQQHQPRQMYQSNSEEIRNFGRPPNNFSQSSHYSAFPRIEYGSCRQISSGYPNANTFQQMPCSAAVRRDTQETRSNMKNINTFLQDARSGVDRKKSALHTGSDDSNLHLKAVKMFNNNLQILDISSLRCQLASKISHEISNGLKILLVASFASGDALLLQECHGLLNSQCDLLVDELLCLGATSKSTITNDEVFAVRTESFERINTIVQIWRNWSFFTAHAQALGANRKVQNSIRITARCLLVSLGANLDPSFIFLSARPALSERFGSELDLVCDGGAPIPILQLDGFSELALQIISHLLILVSNMSLHASCWVEGHGIVDGAERGKSTRQRDTRGVAGVLASIFDLCLFGLMWDEYWLDLYRSQFPNQLATVNGDLTECAAVSLHTMTNIFLHSGLLPVWHCLFLHVADGFDCLMLFARTCGYLIQAPRDVSDPKRTIGLLFLRSLARAGHIICRALFTWLRAVSVQPRGAPEYSPVAQLMRNLSPGYLGDILSRDVLNELVPILMRVQSALTDPTTAPMPNCADISLSGRKEIARQLWNLCSVTGSGPTLESESGRSAVTMVANSREPVLADFDALQNELMGLAVTKEPIEFSVRENAAWLAMDIVYGFHDDGARSVTALR